MSVFVGASMTTSRRIVGLLLVIVSLGLLYPGVSQPILTLTGQIEKSQIAELGIDMIAGEGADQQTRSMLGMISSMLGLDQIEGQLEAYRSTRSIWGTVESLARTGNLPVAFLIVFFCLIIPVFKLLLQLASLIIPAVQWRQGFLWLNAVLSKWSMVDVFVMALLVAFMAGNATGQAGDLLIMTAQLEVGFYYFLAYCLFSIATSSVLRYEPATAG